MKPPVLHVLYEDNHLLAVVKPAGLATMGTPEGRPTLLSAAKAYIRERYHKPGNVYLGVVSRLDAPVTGVVLLARTSKAANRLTEQFRAHSVEKQYWALVEGAVDPPTGSLVDWLGHDDRHRRMHIVGPAFPGAREARLSFRRIAGRGGANIVARGDPRAPTAGQETSLLEVTLETGRKHQIRLQLAHCGHPIVGDRKYGSRLSFPAGIALHARRMVVKHPTTGAQIELEAPLPQAWKELGVRS
jgi:23S rRNA pseudouridine1911/1915/1917 synthase